MPGSSSTLPSANLPTRIFGPCRSAMMATSRPARWAASRTRRARSMWSWAVPWLKFSRITLTPARINCSRSLGSLEAGPRVATILVARRAMDVLPGVGSSAAAILTRQQRQTHAPAGERARRAAARSTRGALLQDFECRERLAFQHLEEGAATGGDVTHVLLDAVLGDGGQRVAAAGDAERIRVGDCAGDGLGALGEGIELEHAHGAVPDDGAGGLQLLRQAGRGLRADVQDQVVI